MKYVRSFLPWIAFATIAGHIDWRYTALLGLVMSVVVLVWGRREKKPADGLVLEISGTVFFALLAAFAFAFNRLGPALHSYVIAMAAGWLAVTAWLSIVTRHPFTLGIAKTMVAPEVWRSPRFLRVNLVMSSVWALSFTAEAVALGIVLAAEPDAVIPVIVIKILVWTVPMVFTFAYPAIIRSRAAKQAASARTGQLPVPATGSASAPQHARMPSPPASVAGHPRRVPAQQPGYLAAEEPTRAIMYLDQAPRTGPGGGTGTDQVWPQRHR
jgi:hypothetical protein